MKVFISYRRAISYWHASLLEQLLKRDNFDVFIDYERLEPGPYPIQLENNIKFADAFILVLNQKSLDNCINEKDWVRREVELAMNHDIEIIPVLDINFDWTKIKSLPDSLRKLYEYQSIDFTSDNIENSIEKLKRLLLKIPIKSKGHTILPHAFIDCSRKLSHMNTISNAYKLQSILSGLTYNRLTTSTLRTFFDESENKNDILNFSTEIVINLWPPITTEEKNMIGLAATLLGVRFKMWHPRRNIIEKLSELCKRGLNEEDISKIEFIEPIAIALGGIGEFTIHRCHFYKSLSSEEWGKSDTQRVMGYYGKESQMLLAIKQHLTDSNRDRLLKASDLNRILFLAQNVSEDKHKDLKNILSNYAVKALNIIKDVGDYEILNLAHKQVQHVFKP